MDKHVKLFLKTLVSTSKKLIKILQSRSDKSHPIFASPTPQYKKATKYIEKLEELLPTIPPQTQFPHDTYHALLNLWDIITLCKEVLTNPRED